MPLDLEGLHDCQSQSMAISKSGPSKYLGKMSCLSSVDRIRSFCGGRLGRSVQILRSGRGQA